MDVGMGRPLTNLFAIDDVHLPDPDTISRVPKNLSLSNVAAVAARFVEVAWHSKSRAVKFSVYIIVVQSITMKVVERLPR